MARRREPGWDRRGARAADDGMVDEVFQQAFIPKRLDEVDTFERDQRRLRAGAG